MKAAKKSPRGSAAARAGAGLACVGLLATLVALAPELGESRPAASLPPIVVVQDDGPAQDAAEARALLAAVRGANPVLCGLAAHALNFRGSWGMGDAEDVPGYETDEDARRVVQWATGGERTGAEAVPVLREALADADPCARRTAALLLGRVRTPAAVDALLEALRGPDRARREAALLGLGLADDERAVQPLLGVLDDGDASIRAGAAWALGRIEAQAAAPRLIDRLRDGDARVRRSAARALGRIEAAAAIPGLAQLLGSDPDATVRRAAAWALGNIDS